MTHLRGWMIVSVVVLICGGAIWFAAHRRAAAIDTPAGLLARLPGRDAVIVSIDFAALRRAGLLDLLARSRTPEDPEYQQFVGRTDFDYKQDLDLVLASFSPVGKYFLLRGRFNWTSLHNYVKAENGSCSNTLCRMSGSTPERKISFFPLQPNIMGLAVSKEADAAGNMMLAASNARPVEPQTDPVWISLPGSVLRQEESLPTGTRMFAQSLGRAEEVVLSLGPQGQAFQATLAARCQTPQDAVQLQGELERVTATLREWIARENRTPNPRDLSGVLTSGAFSHDGRRVSGHWLLAREFVAATLSGGAL